MKQSSIEKCMSLKNVVASFLILYLAACSTGTNYLLGDNNVAILYASDDKITNDIYLLDEEGKRVNLTDSINSNDINPAWSPDGKKIAFTSESVIDGVLRSELFVLELSSLNIEQLTFSNGFNREPDWSPTADEIIFWTTNDFNSEIYLIDLETKASKNLTRNEESSDIMPAWSPNGEEIIFASDREGSIDIFVIDRNGSDLAQLTNSEADDLFPVWSPSGNEIAFVTKFENHFDINIYYTNERLIETIVTISGDGGYLSWGQNESDLLFVADDNGSSQIFLLDIATKETQQLTHDSGNKSYPSFRPLSD